MAYNSLYFCYLVFGLTVLGGVAGWDNTWDRFFWKECPQNQAFYRMRSVHDNGKVSKSIYLRYKIMCSFIKRFQDKIDNRREK